MNINEASEHLRRLAQDNPHRSKTGHLRELYVEIEAARKAGVTTEQIVDALNEKGLDISLGTFVTLLHRIRKQLSQQNGRVATVAAGYSQNRRVSDEQGLKMKDSEQLAVVAAPVPARGVRKTKQKELTTRERITADMAEYEAEQAARCIPVKKL